MKYAEFIRIIEARGFKMDRQNGSHRIYEGFVDGKRCAVTVAYHRINDEILPKNFASMIRQSGLNKKLFKR